MDLFQAFDDFFTSNAFPRPLHQKFEEFPWRLPPPPQKIRYRTPSPPQKSNPTQYRHVTEIQSQNDKNNKPQIRKVETKYINGYTQDGQRIYQNLQIYENTQTGEKQFIDERNLNGRGKKIIRETRNGKTQQEEKFSNLETKDSQEFDKVYEKAIQNLTDQYEKELKQEKKIVSQDPNTENIQWNGSQYSVKKSNQKESKENSNVGVDAEKVPIAKL